MRCGVAKPVSASPPALAQLFVVVTPGQPNRPCRLTAPRISLSSGTVWMTRRRSGVRRTGHVAATRRLVERTQETRPHGGVCRRPATGHALARVARQREHEPLAGGAEPAGCPVETVEHDALDRRIEAASREGRSLGTRVCDRNRSLRSLHDLACDERDARREEHDDDPDRRSDVPAAHGSTRLRNTTASSSAHAASAAEKRKAVRKLRVIVPSMVAITSSRTAATSLS